MGIIQSARKSAKMIPRAPASSLHRPEFKSELCHHRAMRLKLTEPQLPQQKAEGNNSLLTAVSKGSGKDDECRF